jgi:hypothetical protein
MSAFNRLREFIEGEDAKADDIEVEFDNIAATLKGGITGANIANGSIGPAQLKLGYALHHVFTPVACHIAAGSQLGAVSVIAHGLGGLPFGVEFTAITAEGYAIVLEGRLIAMDETHYTWQPVASSPIPGGGVDFTMICHAMGA